MARIVVFGPHPDDQELGMGGSIALLASRGHDVLIADLTNGEPTPHGTPESRREEALAAAAILGEAAGGVDGSAWDGRPIPRVCLGLPNRCVVHTVEARRLVAAAIRAWRAEVLFTTHPEDAHPDHVAGTRIVEDARFDAKLTKEVFPPPVDHWTGAAMGGPGVVGTVDAADTERCHPLYVFYYYATHLRRVADPTWLLDTSAFADAKERAILAYRTQFVLAEQNRRVVEAVRAGGAYFGSRILTAAAEPFAGREPLGLAGLGDLIL